MIFSKDETRVELVLNGAKERNKAFFDHPFSQRAEIEQVFGSSLDWRRMDDNKVSVITYAQPFDGYDRANWPPIIAWLVRHIQKLEKAFASRIPALRQVRAYVSKSAVAETSVSTTE